MPQSQVVRGLVSEHISAQGQVGWPARLEGRQILREEDPGLPAVVDRIRQALVDLSGADRRKPTDELSGAGSKSVDEIEKQLHKRQQAGFVRRSLEKKRIDQPGDLQRRVDQPRIG